MAWGDFRGGSPDIYAQRVLLNGQVGGFVVSVGDLHFSAFALDPPRPNPSRGRIAVHFVTPSAGSVQLELLDVTGRRIVSEEVGSLGSGRHAFSFEGAKGLPGGLYFLRLRQGRRVQSRPVILLN
jgi:hypothetical protein